MIRKTTLSRLSAAALCIGCATAANVAQAFDFGNMMNPSRWFDNDRYDRDYYRGYGYGPYGGYGYGPYGGYGGPYGGPWGGGYPGYGWGGYPGYGGGYGGGYPSTIVVNPTPGTSNEAPAPRLPE